MRIKLKLIRNGMKEMGEKSAGTHKDHQEEQQ
jgi:hypothetical protein